MLQYPEVSQLSSPPPPRIRKQASLTLTPPTKDVAECTLQPLQWYPLDAAIVFSNILVIPQAAGMSVTMPGGVGILVPDPILTPDDIPKYDLSTATAMSKLAHVLDSVTLIKKKMTEEGFESTPLIGFSAALFMLFYMVGGSSKKNPNAGVEFLKTYPVEGRALLDQLTGRRLGR